MPDSETAYSMQDARVRDQAGNNDATSPGHYRQHPSGIECITIAEAFSFNLGNVIKYVWRAGLKSDDAIEDLKKARRYLDFEINRLEQGDQT